MPNKIIRDSFFIDVKSAIEKARSVAQIDHPGVKGRIREIFVKDMLRPILPPFVEFGSGKIVDSKGNESAQTDVIVYGRQILPPLLFEREFGVYPAEAVIYAIEVKSKLTAEEIKSTMDNFKRLQNLQYLPAILDEKYQSNGFNSAPVIPCVFAFESDLAGDVVAEISRYKKYDVNADICPAIPVFCVVGKGYWWFRSCEPKEKWITLFSTKEYEEVIEFIGGIANTIPEQIVKKGRPRFGEYIIRPRQLEKH